MYSQGQKIGFYTSLYSNLKLHISKINFSANELTMIAKLMFIVVIRALNPVTYSNYLEDTYFKKCIIVYS